MRSQGDEVSSRLPRKRRLVGGLSILLAVLLGGGIAMAVSGRSTKRVARPPATTTTEVTARSLTTAATTTTAASQVPITQDQGSPTTAPKTTVSLPATIAEPPSTTTTLPLGPTWLEVASGSPPVSTVGGNPDIAYDAATKTDILLGTDGSTWSWNGSTWTELFPTTTPPDREDASMTYDTATEEIVLFGGTTNAESILDDTWTWNGTNWTQQNPDTSPPPLSAAAFADDPITGQPVLFGGLGYQNNASLDYGYSGETWTWNGTNWTQDFPANSPSPRTASSAAFDPATASVVLFGGVCTCSNLLNDTWTWNGSNWTHEPTPNAPPVGHYEAPMNYDSTVQEEVLFYGGTTWLWTNGVWTEASPRNVPPNPEPFIGGGVDPATGDPLIIDVQGNGIPAETWIYQAS